ncbi:IS605 OrfB family transposase [Streptomyces sp. PanSC19]|nr:IS605 OrfB family transposase [Streptomyces sp. PanSC19]
MIRHRLSLPIGTKGAKKAPGGYRTRQEWHAKSRRLRVLEDRLAAAQADAAAGRVRVVRGGKRLARSRHNLEAARLTEAEWRARWEAERWFCQADGEAGKRYGNDTIRVSPDGEVSIKLPTPLKHLANAPRGRYALPVRVRFAHRGGKWADRVEANGAVAYRIHYDVARGRWYLTASWQIPVAPTVLLATALADGVIGVDMNADHLAAWRLDPHGNPVGHPRRFPYDLTGSAGYRDAQVRHALTRLLHWAQTCRVRAIAVEDLDFAAEKTREKHGRKRRFRQLVSGMPTSRLRARLTSMAVATGIAVIAVDPAYTSRWGAQHWQEPLTSPTRKTTRHDAAAVAIGRRAQGHPIRRRTAPPPHDRWGLPCSNEVESLGKIVQGIGPSRPDQAPSGVRNPATASPDHGPDPRRPDAERTRATRASNTVRDVRLSTSPGNRTHSRSVLRNGSSTQGSSETLSAPI